MTRSPDHPMRRARRAALGWGLFLFALTSWPKPPRVPVLSGIPNFDKVVHFGLYAVEALFLYQAVRWAGRAGFSLARVLVSARGPGSSAKGNPLSGPSRAGRGSPNHKFFWAEIPRCARDELARGFARQFIS